MGRQASFDFIVIKSTKEKSRENHKQTNKQTNEKGRGKGGNFKEKKESGKKNEHEICRRALRICETIRLRFVDPIEFKAQIFLMSFLARSIHNKKCICR